MRGNQSCPAPSSHVRLCIRGEGLLQQDVFMDVLIMIICAVVVLGVLVFIHEGGHYLAARSFGVRVTEFMIGLPGPSVGKVIGGTRFGVTAVPLGGYARVCGMEAGKMKPHLAEVLASLYRRGTATRAQVAADCGITEDAASEALDELVEWGSCTAPGRKDDPDTYRAPRVVPTKKEIMAAQAAGEEPPASYDLGQAREVEDARALYESEYDQQYRALPFWKRSVILLAGIATNLLFTIIVFVVVYTILGVDVTNADTGEIIHYHAAPLQAIQSGFAYIGMVVQAIIGLFNPSTAAETVSNSTSIMGIAVLSKSYFEAGLAEALFFMAMISTSLGLMNLLPIPPLDGGRFLVEILQKISRRIVPVKVMNSISVAGMVLFLGFFVVMLNQDVQRFVLGNWQ